MEESTGQQQERGNDKFGNSQVIWIAKHAKIKSLLEKDALEIVQAVASQSFYNVSGLEVQGIQSYRGLCEIGCVTYRSSQQKLGIDISLSRKVCGRNFSLTR